MTIRAIRSEELRRGSVEIDWSCGILGEDPKQFDKFRSTIIDDIAPQGALEDFFVENLVVDGWRLRRIPRFETALYRRLERLLRLQAAESEKRAHETEINPATHLFKIMRPGVQEGEFWEHHAAEAKLEELQEEPVPEIIGFVRLLETHWATFSNLERYGGALFRSFARTLRELQNLRAMKWARECQLRQFLDIDVDKRVRKYTPRKLSETRT